MKPPAILYCHCQHARILPEEVKKAALKSLTESGQPFEAVPDLCEASARRDPALARIAGLGSLKIAACYPRAIKWLFHAAGAPLSIEETQIVNLRVLNGAQAAEELMSGTLSPNLPSGKVTALDAPVPVTT